ncbi:MAG: hydroxyisourate hydrolase [Moraxellaceae bacterium]
MYRRILATITLLAASMMAFAAENPLSVHVLNTQDGLPGPNIDVELEYRNDGKWELLNTAKTNKNGRITALYPSGKEFKKGVYKVTFKTGDWLKGKNVATFFPEIPVVFEVDGKLEHYHIPLLLSPFGYSTYRGN